MNLNIKLMQRIGYSLIVASLILFSVSVVSVYSNSATFNRNISPGSSVTLAMNKNTSAGDDILYSLSPSNGTMTITAFLSGPSGQRLGYSNASGATYTISREVVSPEAGLYTLTVMNHGNDTLGVKVIVGKISYTTLSMFLLGFGLLPSGIALVILSMIIRRRESRFSRYRF